MIRSWNKVTNWCPIQQTDFNEGEEILVENGIYRPNDLFRVKVLGMFPKFAEDVCLSPYEWIEIANNQILVRIKRERVQNQQDHKVGQDIAVWVEIVQLSVQGRVIGRFILKHTPISRSCRPYA